MATSISFIRRIKNLAKRSELLVRLYEVYKFFKPLLVKGLLGLCKDIRKTRLFFTVMPYTMMNYETLSKLQELSRHLESEGISGNFVECGVRNGGSAAVIATAVKENKNRHVWLFDSWEGFPETDERDINDDLEQAQKGSCSSSEETVRELFFHRLHLDSTRIHLVKGWFNDTLPDKDIGKIALLHLNCDLYESTSHCIEQLYDNVTEGGCIVITDYRLFKGSEEATNEFIKRRNLNVELIENGKFGVYFFK